MIRTILFVGILAAFPGIAKAQVSIQEAQSRLQAKEHAREVAATQPTTLTNAQVEELQKVIRQQEGEIASLKQQIASLRQKLTPDTPPTAAIHMDPIQDLKAHLVGMKIASAVYSVL